MANNEQVLRQFPLLARLSPAILTEIQGCLVEISCARRSFIFREGDPCRGLYFLHRGRVKLLKRSSDGRELAIAILRPGDIFDPAPIFDDGPQMVTAQALDPVSLRFLSKDDVVRLATCHAELATALLTSVFDTLRQLTNLVEQISVKTVTARLAAYLLAQATDGTSQIHLDISQRELAALMGTRREVLSRTLGKLERDGILQVRYPTIMIVDRERLRHLT
jgi:CRP/FNR family transcriptional regulator